MIISVSISPFDFDAAIKGAQLLGVSGEYPPGCLRAPLSGSTPGTVSEVWDYIEAALRKTYEEGKVSARELIDKATVKMAEAASTLSNKAAEFRDAIRAKLEAFLHKIVDAALKLVRSEITVGGKPLALKNVKISQSIKISGSLKASLEEICEIISEGEFAVEAEYEAA